MKKNVFGRKLKRDSNERKALFKNLMSSLILSERIKTTEAKAKAIKGSVEKLVTKVKKKGESARNTLLIDLTSPAIEKLIVDLAPRFVNRPGGYTRIIKLQNRVADNASQVYIEWVEKSSALVTTQAEPKKSKDKSKPKKETKKEVVKKESKTPEKKKEKSTKTK